jgi:hypothetical protein
MRNTIRIRPDAFGQLNRPTAYISESTRTGAPFALRGAGIVHTSPRRATPSAFLRMPHFVGLKVLASRSGIAGEFSSFVETLNFQKVLIHSFNLLKISQMDD